MTTPSQGPGPSTESSHEAESDMLDPEERMRSRSSEWFPGDKVATYMVGRVLKPFDKDQKLPMVGMLLRVRLQLLRRLTPEWPLFWQTTLGTPRKGLTALDEKL
ncbi:hypothetical protein NDU88_002066 [Pleurodeles waltl]|uniref:Uncharacterized protein n=1 Tax=Pleurodeles waltl TaxID=8319 RepID=A0AAV7NM05_PLEWA|nr:hypothetical protein NDU88_002066 [Pleurodeles waltl]